MRVGVMRVRMAVIVIMAVSVIMVVMVPVGLVTAFNVMVMRFLRQTHFAFKTQDLLAVLAVEAVHDVLPGHALLDAILEGIEHEIVVVQVSSLDEL